ncbi:hypothetical protein RND81_14G139200 [Saponaria officinalis]|uniref:Uncharacterized protein n=1 Tax=Saponaria officinalis TaxID=3572 RepID=A0AAW1GQ62_SAPOF
MATSFVSHAKLITFIFLIYSSDFFIDGHARMLHNNKVPNINSNQILQDLGFHEVLKFQRHPPIWVQVGIGSDRISPGGPDSQHHAQPPTLLR